MEILSHKIVNYIIKYMKLIFKSLFFAVCFPWLHDFMSIFGSGFCFGSGFGSSLFSVPVQKLQTYFRFGSGCVWYFGSGRSLATTRYRLRNADIKSTTLTVITISSFYSAETFTLPVSPCGQSRSEYKNNFQKSWKFFKS